VKFIRSFMLISLLMGTSSYAQKINCPPYSTTPNAYYNGPDDQFVAISQFSSDFISLDLITQKYIKRISQQFNSMGVTLVASILPQAGFAFLGRLDSTTIKGTRFEEASKVTQLPSLIEGYTKNIKQLDSLGIESINLMQGMAEFQNKTGDSLFFKHDGHWNRAGAQAAAITTAAYLKTYHQPLLDDAQPDLYKVNIVKTIDRTSTGGWDGTIMQKCPEHKLYVEKFDVLALETRSLGLLDDEPTPILLLGTSFSSNPPQFGYDLYLSESLGKPVINSSLSGGGPLGAMREYFETRKTEDKLPKIAIWELPLPQLTNPNISYGFNDLSFRQLMPSLYPQRQTIDVLDTPAVSGQAQFKVLSPASAASAIEVSLKDSYTRSLKLDIVYTNGTETVVLKNTHGSVLNRYVLEMPEDKGELKSIVVSADGMKGTVEIQFLNYKR
jgi:hypothetical protein